MKKIEVNELRVRARNPSSRIAPLSKANSLEMQYHPITHDARPARSDFISSYDGEIGPAKGLVLSAQYAASQV